jgi:signal transduction histidine kinase
VQDISSKTKPTETYRKYTKSSSFLMALVFTILCGTSALSFGYFINYFAKGHFVYSTDAVLNAEIGYIEALGPAAQFPEKENQLYILLNEHGDLPESIPASFSLLSEGIIVFDLPETHKRYAAKVHTFENGERLLVGFDITKTSKDFKFMQWLGIASIVFVMLVVFVAYIISIFVVRGTNKIANTAHEIMATGDLSQRVEVGSRWDDLSNMAAVLNMLLNRIEELMQGVRQVSDNIAHDLRTPLARMRNKIETLQQEDDKEVYTDLLAEADQLLGTFNALLRISRLESEKKRSHFADVNLKGLLKDVVALYEPLAEDKNITVSCAFENINYSGDRDFLFQAYANLLDNAVKFTPEKGTITINLQHEHDLIYITVSDTGMGVDDEETDKIFNRFYRSEQSRNTEGTGLGLSLVAAVIHLHGGEIKATNTNPGLRIITVL